MAKLAGQGSDDRVHGKHEPGAAENSGHGEQRPAHRTRRSACQRAKQDGGFEEEVASQFVGGCELDPDA